MRYRRLTEAVFLALVLACLLLCQVDSVPKAASIYSPQDKPLRLTMRVLREQYCTGDSELDGLRLSVRLIYTNQSKETLILYKGSKGVSRLMISRNFADLTAKRFEVNSSLTEVSSGGEKCYKGRVPSSCFVSLGPNASYEVEATVGLFVVRGDAREITGAVKSGEHVLQIEVPTWPESDELAKELNSRWQRSGRLWTKPVTSEPVRFMVKKEHSVIDCP